MTALPRNLKNILVIKLGALGDFVQAFGPFNAIRRARPKAHITLLTTAPFKELAEKSGWFDDVWVDDKPKRIGQYFALRQKLRAGKFDMVFDLQTSDRSALYWRMMWPGQPALSGIAGGASHPHANPNRDRMHTLDRQREQLEMAGISKFPEPRLNWADADLSAFDLPKDFALIVPGGAPHRPEKRWTVKGFSDLANHLVSTDLTPVLIGTDADAEWTAAIAKSCPVAVDLTGKTSLFELAGLARRAELAIGNDTGPMHMTAALGCRSVVLYSHASDPKLCGQRGKHVSIVRVHKLGELPLITVLDAIKRT